MAVKTERFIGLGQTLLHCKALTIIFKIGYGKTISHDSQISPNCEFFPSWAHCAAHTTPVGVEPHGPSLGAPPKHTVPLGVDLARPVFKKTGPKSLAREL